MNPIASDEARAARTAIRFVVLIGVLSLFADFVYEGSRSVIGPYLGGLGATATIIGVVTGLGELLGYGLRLLSGRFADVTGKVWPTIIAGYLLQMCAVPALALTNNWLSASVLIVLERVGKAIRNPPRDVLLSYASRRVGGYGWAFGVHEALDQLGAMIGPLVVATVLGHRGRYHEAFAILVFPGIVNLTLVFIARRFFPRPQDLDKALPDLKTGGFPRTYWLYLAAAGLIAAGFVDYPLIAYHFGRTRVVDLQDVPIFYAVAMAAGGGGSLLLGRLFDRYGFRVLIVLTLMTTLYVPLVFLGGYWWALVGMVLWGLGTGAHGSVIPAAVAPMVDASRRAYAFGLFTAGYGICWFVGSVIAGLLYDRSLHATVLFCLIAGFAAIPLLVRISGGGQGPTQPSATGELSR